MTLSLQALLPAPAAAASPAHGTRPKIGLVLGGGGARGAAHVGVLKVLEARGIPIDYVAGTSMGAIVGGLYAMGTSPADIEAIVKEIDWGDIFRDAPQRSERRFRRKQDDRSFLADIRPGVIESEARIELVPALIQGQKLGLALRRYTLPAAEIRDFDRLPIPFRAVATDVVTGDAVVMGEGDLVTAIRASMAVPAVFAPVEYEDRLLVDGGLARNLPVDVVRAMGADLVIAVDVGGPRRERGEISNVLDMLDQIAALVTARNTDEQIATLGSRDLLIVPPLGREVLASDFDKMQQAIAIGEGAAERAGIELARYGVPSAAYAAYRSAHRRAPFEPPVIDAIRIENDSRLSDAVIASRLDIHAGERLNPATLERDLGRVFDQDIFESVRYRLDREDGETALVVDAHKKSWGTSWLQAGLQLSATGAGDSLFNLGLAYTMAPLTPLNGEWRTVLRLGEEPGLSTGVYLPLDPAERWYVQGGLGFISTNLRQFTAESRDTPVAEYQLTRAGGLAEVGRNLGDWGRLGLRYNLYRGDVDLRVGPPRYEGFEFDVGEVSLNLGIDSLDSLDFPRRGWGGQLYANLSRGWLGASHDYEQLGFDLLRAGSLKDNSLVWGLSFGSNRDGDAPLQAYYRLGGFLNLSGFNQSELSGPYAGLARAVYMRRLGSGLVETYAGASLEFGNTWQETGDIRFDTTRAAGSLFLGADTVLGPVYLGYGHADGGNQALYLYLGRPWLVGLREW